MLTKVWLKISCFSRSAAQPLSCSVAQLLSCSAAQLQASSNCRFLATAARRSASCSSRSSSSFRQPLGRLHGGPVRGSPKREYVYIHIYTHICIYIYIYSHIPYNIRKTTFYKNWTCSWTHHNLILMIPYFVARKIWSDPYHHFQQRYMA